MVCALAAEWHQSSAGDSWVVNCVLGFAIAIGLVLLGIFTLVFLISFVRAWWSRPELSAVLTRRGIPATRTNKMVVVGSTLSVVTSALVALVAVAGRVAFDSTVVRSVAQVALIVLAVDVGCRVWWWSQRRPGDTSA